MKKKVIAAGLALAAILSNATVVCAAPVSMPDGTVFDAEYYAQSNPDVTAVFGTDANVLYEHYKNFGKAEGRKPYEEAAGNNTATEFSVPVGFTTIHINQKDGFEGAFFTNLDRTKYPGIDAVEHIKGLDLCSQIERINHDGLSALVGMEPGGTTAEMMSYVIGGSGILESYVKNSPTEYSFYVLNNGLRYRFDLHYNEHLRIQSFDYGVVGTVTEQELKAAEANLPNLKPERKVVTTEGLDASQFR